MMIPIKFDQENAERRMRIYKEKLLKEASVQYWNEFED